MIDWSKYPDLEACIHNGQSCDFDLHALIGDVRRAERERCADVCSSYQLPEWPRDGRASGDCPRYHRESDPTLVADDCAAAILALEDEP